MIWDITAFNEEDDLFDVYECLMENSSRRVPILSEDKFLGHISRRDKIHTMIHPETQGKRVSLIACLIIVRKVHGETTPPLGNRP